MCFRPGNVEAPIVCPTCNNRVPIVSGFRPKACPLCGNDLPGENAQPPAVPPAAAPIAAPAAPKPPQEGGL